jgi:UDP-N-acetylmuramate dehydrogenase
MGAGDVDALARSLAFQNRLQQNEPLAPHTTFHVGGMAKWFVSVRNVAEVSQAIAFAKKERIPWFVLGGGTNTLVSDAGFQGLVIQMTNRDVLVQGERVTCGAGALSVSVARAAVKASLTGLEWAVSLPGTVGGAVRGNAGCFGGEIKDALEQAAVLTSEGLKILSNKDLGFSYRDSVLKKRLWVVVEAVFRLQKGDRALIKQKMDFVLNKRKTTQPISTGSCGCVFKNVLFEAEADIVKLRGRVKNIPEVFLQNKSIGAGWLIDQLGLKGTKIGGVQISEEHGNFILNTKNGTADQVIQLIALIKTRVRNELGVQLQEEIEYVGFGLFDLHKHVPAGVL